MKTMDSLMLSGIWPPKFQGGWPLLKRRYIMYMVLAVNALVALTWIIHSTSLARMSAEKSDLRRFVEKQDRSKDSLCGDGYCTRNQVHNHPDPRGDALKVQQETPQKQDIPMSDVDLKHNQKMQYGVNRSRNRSQQNEPKKVLFWTTFFGAVDYEFGLGKRPFRVCPVSNCMTTANKAEADSAHAVIFHMRNVQPGMAFPKRSSEKQLFIFYLLEHPYHQWNDLRAFEGVFNMTMTYRLDSDIPIPYGWIERKSHPEQFSSAFDPAIIPKRKTLAWFVSNCQTHSKREAYVKELSKHVDVDVYGHCGTLRCPSGNVSPFAGRTYPHCYSMLEKKYNFYLSFENIFCKDYVTEKMFNILKLDVVPIVFGAVNYTAVAPPNSVINAADFDSPRQLAQYILALEKKPLKYLEYFQWKPYFDIKTETYVKGFCNLCAALHDEGYPHKVHNNLKDWWGKEKLCDLNSINKFKRNGRWGS